MLLIRTLKQKILSLPCTVSPCYYVVTTYLHETLKNKEISTKTIAMKR